VPACGYTLTPMSQSFDFNGGTGSSSLTTGSGCQWNASTNAPWITLTSPVSGTGSASIAYSVAQNNDPKPRTGTITVAGQSAGQMITVIQGGTTVDVSCTSADSSDPAQTACDNQSVLIDPPIVGTPFELHYDGEHVAGRAGATAFLTGFSSDLGGWTVNVRHAYDPLSGNLYLGDGSRRRAAVLGSPPVVDGNYLVTNQEGTEVYVFDSTGRHLQTQQALTGALVYKFGYDANGRLSTITDVAGNVTTVQRDAGGNPSAVVGPYGQKTTITVSSDGYITQITNPNQETMSFTYGTGGLIATMTDAVGNVDNFQYDSQGLLTHAAHAGGASEDLAQSSSASPPTITLTTAAGVVTTYADDLSTPGTEARTVTFASGLQASTESSATSFSSASPDGTNLQSAFTPDPRWGIQAPVIGSSNITTPGGLHSTEVETVAAALNTGGDPFSQSSLTDTITVNGRQSTATYNSGTRTLSLLSPAGRTANTTFDPSGRIILRQVGGFDPTTFTYDGHGRFNTITLGSGSSAQTVSFAYNAQGYVSSLTDSAQRVFGFAYDGAGRIIKETLSQGASILNSYDANGRLMSVTTPGHNLHSFAYTASGLLAKYTPPGFNGVNAEADLTYNADGQLSQLTRGGQTVNVSYDNAGRPSTVNLPTGAIGLSYDGKTGNLIGLSGPGSVGLSMAYDGALLTQQGWSGPVSGTVTNTYDNNFFLIGRSVNNGRAISYQLDADGLLTQAGTLKIMRDPLAGQPTGTVIDNIADTFLYDSVGRVAGYSANVGGSPIYAIQLKRDVLGRVVSKNDSPSRGVATQANPHPGGLLLFVSAEEGRPSPSSRSRHRSGARLDRLPDRSV
jgi:YD repeat-containing protein